MCLWSFYRIVFILRHCLHAVRIVWVTKPPKLKRTETDVQTDRHTHILTYKAAPYIVWSGWKNKAWSLDHTWNTCLPYYYVWELQTFKPPITTLYLLPNGPVQADHNTRCVLWCAWIGALKYFDEKAKE